MKNMKYIASTFLIVFCLSSISTAQTVEGLWVTIDDKTGEERSHVEIYKEEGQLQAKIIKLLQKESAEVCTKCKDHRKDKPIVGMHILSEMKGEDTKYSGRILDPEDGKVYKCKLTLVEDDKIKLRGYIGSPILGRTVYWHRLK